MSRNLSIALGLLVAVAAGWLYWDQLYVPEDIQGEACEGPLVVGYLERARAEGMSAEEFLDHSQICLSLRQNLPSQEHQFFGRSYFNHFFYARPLVNILYWPCVKVLGVGPHTVRVYSTVLSMLALVSSWYLARVLFGRACAFLAVALLLTSVIWLIHTKVGYGMWFPSVILMNGFVHCLFRHCLDPRPCWLCAMGAILGLMWLLGWIGIVFAVLILVPGLFCGPTKRLASITTQFFQIVACAVLVALCVSVCYACYYGCQVTEIQKAIWEVMGGRFGQGGEPIRQAMPVFDRVFYALRCVFVDSQTSDSHADKYLEGAPAIPVLFAVLFVVGLIHAARRRSLSDQILGLWLVVVFGFLTVIYIYGHRYVLLVLPCMAIVAAAAGLELLRRFAFVGRFFMSFLLLVCLALSLRTTHREFYNGYTNHKPENYEADRVRGHVAVAHWLQDHCAPRETLLVLGDEIHFSFPTYLLNTFDQQYEFTVWTSHFSPTATPDQIRQWETQELASRRHLVFAFSTKLIASSVNPVPVNDWRPFLAAHQGASPIATISYDGRAPSILIFDLTK